jgi:hypothetical protein
LLEKVGIIAVSAALGFGAAVAAAACGEDRGSVEVEGGTTGGGTGTTGTAPPDTQGTSTAP